MKVTKPKQKYIPLIRNKEEVQIKKKIMKVKQQAKKQEIIQNEKQLQEKNKMPEFTYFEDMYKLISNQLPYEYYDNKRIIEEKQILMEGGGNLNLTAKKKRINKYAQQKKLDKFLIADFDDDTRQFFKMEEILQIRQNIDDMNFGEFVLAFPNPDYEKCDNKVITLQEALKIYEQDIIVKTNMTTNDFFMEKEAFVKAFLDLPDYLDQENTRKEIQSRKKLAEEGGDKLDVPNDDDKYWICIQNLDNKKEKQKKIFYYKERIKKLNMLKMNAQKNQERVFLHINKKFQYYALKERLKKDFIKKKIAEKAQEIKKKKQEYKDNLTPQKEAEINKLKDDIIKQEQKLEKLKKQQNPDLDKFAKMMHLDTVAKKMKDLEKDIIGQNSMQKSLKQQKSLRRQITVVKKIEVENLDKDNQLEKQQISDDKINLNKNILIRITDEENKEKIMKINKAMHTNSIDQVIIKPIDEMKNNNDEQQKINEEQQSVDKTQSIKRQWQQYQIQKNQLKNKNNENSEEEQEDKQKIYNDKLQKLKEDNEKKIKLKTQEMNNFIQQQTQNLIKDDIKDKLYKCQEFDMKDLKIYMQEKKNWSQGGFSYVYKDPDTDELTFKCRDEKPRDFLTLLRFIIMSKLAKQGNMHVRSFVTSNLQNVLVVVKSTAEMCQKQACKSKISKQYELGCVDIQSLEPVDHDLRPLRFKIYVNDMEVIKKGDQAKNKNEVHSVKTRAQQIYQDLMALDEDDFKKELNLKQRQNDNWLIYSNKYFDTDFTFEHQEIISDNEITRSEWVTYYIYLEYIHDHMKKFAKCHQKHLEEIKNKVPPEDYQFHLFMRYRFFIMKLILLNALEGANSIQCKFVKKDLKPLENIWQKVGLDQPVSPYTPFISDMDPNYILLWRTYEINEMGQRDIFMPMEKLKMAHQCINQIINIEKMQKQYFITSYFPLHDYFQLYGEKKALLLRPLILTGLINQKKQTQGEKKLYNFFITLSQTAECQDFDSLGNSIQEDLSFNWRKPYHLDMQVVIQYFGEKIAIYFTFLQSYTAFLTSMFIFCIVAHIIYVQNKISVQDNGAVPIPPNEWYKYYTLVIFGFLITIWGDMFIQNWKKNENMFAFKYGQENFENSDTIRSTFRGTYIRSLDRDNINELYYEEFKRNRTKIFNQIVCFIILVCSIFSVIGIQYSKINFFQIKTKCTNAFFCQLTPTFLITIVIMIYNNVYMKIAFQANYEENHKRQSVNEDSLIYKLFFFMFINEFQQLFLIAFLNDALNQFFYSSDLLPSDQKSYKLYCVNNTNCQQITGLGYCVNEKRGPNEKPNNDFCFANIQTQLISSFIVKLALMIPLTLVLRFQANLPRFMKNKNQIKEKIHGFIAIDKHIEEQFMYRLPYITNPQFKEIDGTMAQYIRLIISFAYLNFFGVIYPLMFIFVLIQNIFQVTINKLEMLNVFQRPVPTGAASIGTYFYIIKMIAFVSIYLNAAIVSFTFSPNINGENQYDLFTRNLCIHYFIKILILFAFNEDDRLNKQLRQRQNYIISKFENFFQNADSQTLFKSPNNFEIQGLKIINSQQDKKAKDMKEIFKNLDDSNNDKD